jgi:uncharacterized protein (DUF433 family)/DNA-binding transcriptional MerR regulator
MADVHEMPPRGHYLAQEVGLLAGVSGERIGQWARRGYIRASQSMGRPHVYSYQDIADAMVVHELEDVGADLRSIKRAIQRLRERYGLGWPLQRHKGQLDAVHGSVVKYEDGVALNLGGKGSPEQRVLDAGNLGKIASELERGGWAARLVPNLRFIEVNPDRLSGRPVIRGRRIAADEVARLAISLAGRETLYDDYEITVEEADDAVRWWNAVRLFGQAAA